MALRLAQQAPCLALVRLRIKKLREEPGNLHILASNQGVCTANIVLLSFVSQSIAYGVLFNCIGNEENKTYKRRETTPTY